MLFCKHEWSKLSETLTESNMERQINLLRTLGKVPTQGHPAWFDKKLIQIFECKKCGKIKKFVTEV